MNTHELSRQLLLKDDRQVFISVDVSTCEDDMFKRIYAEIEAVQYDGPEAMIICVKNGEGE